MLTIGSIVLAVVLAATGNAGLVLGSPAFSEGGAIPSAYTCDGRDGSPPLAWSGAPPATRAFALVVHDPDAPAGDWLHWLAWNIPAAANGLPPGVPPKELLPDGTRQGRNDFDKAGYGGPCPPGGTHRYVFRLYALDTTLTLAPNASRADLEGAIAGHVVAQVELTGRYQRTKR